MGLAMLAAVFWLPQWAVPLVLLPICAIAMGEFYSLLDARRIPSYRLIGTLGGVAMVAGTWYGHGHQFPLAGELGETFLYLTMAAIFLQQLLYRESTQPWRRWPAACSPCSTSHSCSATSPASCSWASRKAVT